MKLHLWLVSSMFLAQISFASIPNFSSSFELLIEKWEKGSDGSFFDQGTNTTVLRKDLVLPFDNSTVLQEFDGFSLHITSYVGHNNTSMTIEQNLFQEGHPLNDPVIGISRNHFTVFKADRGLVNYVNYYVNVDDKTKYRIRLWSIDR